MSWDKLVAVYGTKKSHAVHAVSARLAASPDEMKVAKVELVDIQKSAPPAPPQADVQPLDGVFECILCSESYLKQEDLSTHEQAVHSLYACCVCFKVYTSGKRLANHKRVCAQGAKVFLECEKCPKKYRYPKALESHTKREHALLPCSDCPEVFSSGRALAVHSRTAHAAVPRVSCSLCPNSYLSQMYLDRHLRRKHPVYCDVCRKAHADEDKMLRHKRAAHPEAAVRRVQPERSKHPARCGTCGDGGPRRKPLSLLAAALHACSACGQRFESDAKLRRHHETAHAKQRLECGLCGKVVTRSDRLRRHEAVHASERYQCEVCRKVVVGLRRLHKHREAAHSGERHLQCESCPRRFVTADKLRRHQDAQHSATRVECDYCFKMFRCPQTLQTHVAYVHAGRRPYRCQWCDEAFDELAARTKHERIAHSPDYWCHFCLRNFYGIGALYKHVQFICGVKY
ncbi:hypothetical protein ONE63_001651 [Megalurothrips usitatus]|uniref:C2H2-type domain-containing protein n=1 Tax=Megalurothrips usitatus TaxID=439358 RepID=A0AAV7XC45_9NEOP|nr:hypothetical protein ONE63_001651 [Megalurothrips usitatus]